VAPPFGGTKFSNSRVYSDRWNRNPWPRYGASSGGMTPGPGEEGHWPVS